MSCALAVALVLVAQAAPAPSAGAGAWVDKVVAAYGGPAALKKMEASRLKYEVSAWMRGGVGRGTRDFLAPDSLRVEIAYPDRTEVRLLSGNEGWRGDAATVEPVQGVPRTAMVYQLLRANPPWALTTYRDKVSLTPDQTREGKTYKVLRLAWSSDLEVDFWADAAGGRVTRVEALVRGGGMSISFATEYSDFRTVEGVLVPFTEENFASGRHAGTTKVQSVAFTREGLGPFKPSTDGRSPRR